MHIPLEAGIFPKCRDCKEETLLVVVTENNKDKLPFPTHPSGVKTDINDPSKTCQCKAGRCPCGKFVAHKIGDPCLADQYLKESRK